MPRINLLPEREAKKAPVSPKRLIFIIIVEIAIVAALTVYLSQLFTMRQMEAELAQVKAQLAAMQQDLDVLGQVQTRTREIRALADEIRSIQAENRAPAPVLRELRTVVPQDVWLESFSADPGAIDIGRHILDGVGGPPLTAAGALACVRRCPAGFGDPWIQGRKPGVLIQHRLCP